MEDRIFHSASLFTKCLMSSLLAYLTVLSICSTYIIEFSYLSGITSLLLLPVEYLILDRLLSRIYRPLPRQRIEKKYFTITYILLVSEALTIRFIYISIILSVLYLLYFLIFSYLEKIIS